MTIGINWKQSSDGIAMLLFHGDVEYAKGHGVVKLGDQVLMANDNICFFVIWNEL